MTVFGTVTSNDRLRLHSCIPNCLVSSTEVFGTEKATVLPFDTIFADVAPHFVVSGKEDSNNECFFRVLFTRK